MKTHPKLAFLLALFAALATPANEAAAVSVGFHQPFDAGTVLTWTSATSSRIPTGGPTGDGDGFMQVRSTGGGGPGSKLATFSDSPAWSGDFLAAGVSAISVDMMNQSGDGDLAMRLVLIGSNTTNRWTSTEPAHVPDDGVWRTYSFGVSEDALVRVGGSADYASLITDVGRTMFRLDAGEPSNFGTPLASIIGLDNLRVLGSASLCCDYDQSGMLDLADVNRLIGEIVAANGNVDFDVNLDGLVTAADLDSLISDADKFNSYLGDANLDGEFTTGDLVAVFAAGEYEDQLVGNSTWATGDWNGDTEFGTGDLVAAFAAGGFELGPRDATAVAVPEPSGMAVMLLLASFIGWRLQK